MYIFQLQLMCSMSNVTSFTLRQPIRIILLGKYTWKDVHTSFSVVTLIQNSMLLLGHLMQLKW